MQNISVSSLPVQKPIILKPQNTLKEAARAMVENAVGSVLVSDNHGHIQAVVTDRDLCFFTLLQGRQAADSLGNLPTHTVFGVTVNDTLNDVLRVMREKGIRRVPVFQGQNGSGRCVGVLSLDDLIRSRLIEVNEESEILKAQLPEPTRHSQMINPSDVI